MTGQDPDTIAADIEAQREQLAHTLDQIGAKLDVKERQGRELM